MTHCEYCMGWEGGPHATECPYYGVKQPIVFLPLMTKPTREVEKGTKYLPEVWKPNG